MYRCNMSAAGLAGGRLGTFNEALGNKQAGVTPVSACSWLSSPPDASTCAERSSWWWWSTSWVWTTMWAIWSARCATANGVAMPTDCHNKANTSSKDRKRFDMRRIVGHSSERARVVIEIQCQIVDSRANLLGVSGSVPGGNQQGTLPLSPLTPPNRLAATSRIRGSSLSFSRLYCAGVKRTCAEPMVSRAGCSGWALMPAFAKTSVRAWRFAFALFLPAGGFHRIFVV